MLKNVGFIACAYDAFNAFPTRRYLCGCPRNARVHMIDVYIQKCIIVEMLGRPIDNFIILTYLGRQTMNGWSFSRTQVREGMAVAKGSRGEASRLQRLPHLEPPRSVRRRLPQPGPADDGPDTPDVDTLRAVGVQPRRGCFRRLEYRTCRLIGTAPRHCRLLRRKCTHDERLSPPALA